MHLISPLAAGIRGAEGGTAKLYSYRTDARIGFYTGFNGEGGASGDITLDDNGAAVVYVDTIAKVVVLDSDGNTARTFVAGVGDDGVEVRSTSHKGTDYVTNAEAANNPATLATVLDRVKTSFGSTNFQALFRGAATNLQDALSELDMGFFSVVASGAAGDGATDDTSAIQSAINSAEVSGGIVYFPAGTYKISSSLTMKSQVSLLGAGADVSVISQSANADIIEVDSADSSGARWRFIEGLKLRHASSATALGVDMTFAAPANVIIRACDIGDGNTLVTIGGNPSTSGEVLVVACRLECGGVAGMIFNFDVNTAGVHGRMEHCKVVCGANVATDGFIRATNLTLLYNEFDLSNIIGTAADGVVQVGGADSVVAIGNRFGDTGGGDIDAFEITGATSNLFFHEYANSFGSGVRAYDLAGPDSQTSHQGYHLYLGSRTGRVKRQTPSGGGQVPLETAQYGGHIIRIDSSSYAMVNAAGEGFADGQELWVIFESNSSSPGTVEFGAGFFSEHPTGSGFTMSAIDEQVAFLFRSYTDVRDGNQRWIQVGSKVIVS